MSKAPLQPNEKNKGQIALARKFLGQVVRPLLEEQDADLNAVKGLFQSIAVMMDSAYAKYKMDVSLKELNVLKDLKESEDETAKLLCKIVSPFENLDYLVAVTIFDNFAKSIDEIAKLKYGKEKFKDEFDKIFKEEVPTPQS